MYNFLDCSVLPDILINIKQKELSYEQNAFYNTRYF